MADKQWQDMWEIFHHAMELPPGSRGAFLDSACEGDAALRQEIDELLAADSDPDRLLDGGAAAFLGDAPPAPEATVEMTSDQPATSGIPRRRHEMDLLGTQVGTIRLVDVLGEGGMGKVYLGRDEKLKRRVAVKCIHAEYALSADVKARFLQEARILSRLKHPNICQIHDYIEGEDRDFLVLELIEGKTLRQAMRDGLEEAEKNRIALELADVLVAAHAQNVVHRDLKPGNVMLTPEGDIKVLDFGLARSLDDRRPSRAGFPVADALQDTAGGLDQPDPQLVRPEAIGGTLFKTQTGMVMGTPEYMSPEQARAESVTPASDVYSFGLILHRLFTDEPPYGPDLDFIAVAQKAAAADTRPIVGLDGELTALIERTTSLAPGSRPSASDVAERLRYIQGAPVRRRARALRIAAVVALVLIAVAMTFQAFRIRQEADRAQHQQATTEEVLELFISLFEVADPSEARGREVTAREILDRGAQRISRELETEPAIRARLLDTIGVIYTRLGLMNDSKAMLEEALATRRIAGDEADVAASLDHLANLQMGWGNFEAADELSKEALEIRRRLADVDRGTGRQDLADILYLRGQLSARQGRFETAEPLLQQALEIRELEGDPEKIAAALYELALIHDQLGRFEEAERLHQRGIALREQLGSDHPSLGESLNGLAIVYDQQGQHEQAKPLWERALEISEKTLGPQHDQVAMIQTNLASVHSKLGDLAGAEILYEKALQGFEEALGPEHPQVANVLANMANLRARQGLYPQAESLSERAHAIFEQALGPEHPAVAMALRQRGQTLVARRRYSEAEPYFDQALAILEKTLGSEHPTVAQTYDHLSSIYLETGRMEEAQSAAQRAREIAEEALGPDHHKAALFLAGLGDLARRRGELEEAEGHLVRARASLEQSLASGDPKLTRVLLGLANLYRDRGDADRAEPLYHQCAEILKAAHGEDHPGFVTLYEDHAQFLRSSGRASEAGRLEARAESLAQTFGLEPGTKR